MIFNSLHYLVFLPLVTLLYYLLPVRYRWLLLLMASFYFYMVWEPVYILLIITSTFVDYYCGLKMGNLSSKKERKPFMIISLFANLAILSTFKYYNFFSSSVNEILTALNMGYLLPASELLLPLGISFYTFQTMSYSIDIYKGKTTPEKHLGKFSLYVTFFPQLVAGPIERAKDLISQFHFNYKFEWSNISGGLRLILLGLFKKVVIADQLGVMVGHVFNNPEAAQSTSIYIASLLFAQQVYCDFSGYSDIAKGSARLLGVRLMENFNLPFFAKSFVLFWAQWHVSLMNWFRDYIMFPLVKKKWKWQSVFMLIFLVSGIWHGANWTFIIWGIYNGILVIYSRMTLDYRSKLLDNVGLKNFTGLRSFIQAICIYHMFALGSVLFRARSLSESKILIVNLFTDVAGSVNAIIENAGNARQELLYLGKDSVSFFIITGFVVLLEVFQWNLRNRTLDEALDRLNPFVRYSIYVAVLLSISLMSNIAETPFIYFQF